MSDSFSQEVRRAADEIIDRRLGNIEDQMGKFSEAMERLIRMEERLITHLEGEKQMRDDIKEIGRRLGVLEVAQTGTGQRVGDFMAMKAAFAGAALAWFGTWAAQKITGG